MNIQFITKHRSRFDEMDPNGHLNSTSYLNYFSENRHEGHRKVLNQSLFDLAKLPFAIHTKSVNIEYIKPIILDEEFSIISEVKEFGNSSALISFKLLNSKEKISATCEMTVVCISKSTFKPDAWPEDFKKLFKS